MLPILLAVGCVPVLYSKDGGVDPNAEWVAPTNSWPQCAPDAGQVAEGFDPGQTVPDFRMPDQFGAEVSLWQFSCDVVILDISTMWCEPCQDLAADAQEMADDYRDQGFVYVTVLTEDLSYERPSQDELAYWGSSFDLAEPILGDQEFRSQPLVPEGTYPVVLLIDRGMTSVKQITLPQDGADAAIRDEVEEVL